MRYASDETPMTGDRIKNSAGALGTVTAVLAAPSTISAPSTPSHIRVKWDEGVVDIDYDVASKFTLVARRSRASV